MKIYLKYLKKYSFLFILGVMCVALEAVCDLFGPTVMSKIIDAGISAGDIYAIYRLGGLMLGITLAGACFAVTRSILASVVSQRLGADLRADVFKKILHFSERSVDEIEAGSLITRMTNDTSQITLFINGIMRIFLKVPIIGIGGVAFAVALSFKLSLSLLAAALIVSLLIAILLKLSYERFARVQYAIDKVNTVIEEYLLGIRLVKAFGRFSEEEEKFNNENTALAQKSLSSQLAAVIISPIISLTMGVGVAFIIYMGGILFNAGEIEVGKIAAFTSYMNQILFSLVMLTNIFNVFVRTKASTARIQEVLDSEEDISDINGLPFENGNIKFDNVIFAYPNGSGLPVIKNLSFELEKGRNLAVIGATGAGKSTLAWLLLRFYDAGGGKITINGVDIKKIDYKSLRDNIAVATQKSVIFTGTIRENISMGCRAAQAECQATQATSQAAQATSQAAQKMAELARADEFIEKMPEKYESVLEQGGVNLSGGQKQRLSIARALIKDAPILILDDCTSALDSVTEAKIRESLKSLQGAATIIIITQRISAAMSADKILVLDNGVSVGFGGHKELMADCEAYRDIYESQIGGV